MDSQINDAVIQKIQEITANSINVLVDIYVLTGAMPELSFDEVNNFLLYLGEKGLIKVENDSWYHGSRAIKNFRINATFINTYPLAG